jgi:succinyldiaminopimelate transaminase
MSARSLPDFPWDRLHPFRATASAHPDGLVDLSVGTPVDPTPEVVQEALRAAADAPGYPTTQGTLALREAAVRWLDRRTGAVRLDPDAVIPTIGSKELVAWLPTLLGLGPGDRVAHPALAYPTYDVGARLAGAEPVRFDPTRVDDADLAGVRLVWLNTPSNPSGAVMSAEQMRAVVRRARELDAVVASDECYLELGWDTVPVSLLDPRVCDNGLDSLLVVSSASKRSNLAGYRAGLVAGDPSLVAQLLEVRKHAGMIVPTPVQAALAAALDDDAHVDQQRARYARRRTVLRTALEGAGFRVDHSEAGLYLWVTRDEPCMDTVAALAERGVLVAPGDFYGPAGARHVRVALTATDERVESAAGRLSG